MRGIGRGIFLILLLILISASALVGCKSKEEEEVLEKPDLFTSMETVDLEGGKVDRSIFTQNKLTLVNLWNSGCPPCINELPILDKLNEEYRDKGVAIKGLIYEFGAGLEDEIRTEVEGIIREGDIKFQQLLVSEQMLESKILGQVRAFPTTYFVDKDGEIIGFIEGAGNYDEWKGLIEQVLKEVGK